MSSVASLPASPSIQRVAPTHIEPAATLSLSGVDLLGQAAVAPKGAELIATLHMRHGVMVGAFVLDLPQIRTLLVQTAAEAMRQSGLTVQEMAQESVRATGALVVSSAYGARTLVAQAAWATGEACVAGAWQLSTWPARTMYRAVWGASPAA